MSVSWVTSSSKSLTSSIFSMKHAINFLRDSPCSCFIYERACEFFSLYTHKLDMNICLNLMNEMMTPTRKHENHMRDDTLKVVKNIRHSMSSRSNNDVVDEKYVTLSIELV